MAVFFFIIIVSMINFFFLLLGRKSEKKSTFKIKQNIQRESLINLAKIIESKSFSLKGIIDVLRGKKTPKHLTTMNRTHGCVVSLMSGASV